MLSMKTAIDAGANGARRHGRGGGGRAGGKGPVGDAAPAHRNGAKTANRRMLRRGGGGTIGGRGPTGYDLGS